MIVIMIKEPRELGLGVIDATKQATLPKNVEALETKGVKPIQAEVEGLTQDVLQKIIIELLSKHNSKW